VILYPRTTLGDRVILHAGVRVGVEGFGYVFEGGSHRKVPQVGGCFIGDDVEVGANTTIDRGSIGVTRIGSGAKVDNLVQLGHNTVIGPLTMLAAQVGVSGSTEIGSAVVVGGQAGFSGHISVGDGARIAGQSGVTGDIAPGEIVMGFPARPRMEFLRRAAAQGKVDGLLQEIRELRRRIEALTSRGGGESSPP
jgi:UDP-3-O-[3-hydroxymyristoyl] glucosamine N-acyltransferase